VPKSIVKIAELDKRITIEQNSRISDGQGGYLESWTTFATVWAKVKPVNQKERYFSQQIQPVTTHKITIRKLDGVNSQMRISFEGRIMQINGQITADEKDFYNLIDAIEGVGS